MNNFPVKVAFSDDFVILPDATIALPHPLPLSKLERGV
jgi:hypothetical protein